MASALEGPVSEVADIRLGSASDSDQSIAARRLSRTADIAKKESPTGPRGADGARVTCSLLGQKLQLMGSNLQHLVSPTHMVCGDA